MIKVHDLKVTRHRGYAILNYQTNMSFFVSINGSIPSDLVWKEIGFVDVLNKVKNSPIILEIHD